MFFFLLFSCWWSEFLSESKLRRWNVERYLRTRWHTSGTLRSDANHRSGQESTDLDQWSTRSHFLLPTSHQHTSKDLQSWPTRLIITWLLYVLLVPHFLYDLRIHLLKIHVSVKLMLYNMQVIFGFNEWLTIFNSINKKHRKKRKY